MTKLLISATIMLHLLHGQVGGGEKLAIFIGRKNEHSILFILLPKILCLFFSSKSGYLFAPLDYAYFNCNWRAESKSQIAQ